MITMGAEVLSRQFSSSHASMSDPNKIWEKSIEAWDSMKFYIFRKKGDFVQISAKFKFGAKQFFVIVDRM